MTTNHFCLLPSLPRRSFGLPARSFVAQAGAQAGALCLCSGTARFTPHASRITHHAFTFHAFTLSRFTFHALGTVRYGSGTALGRLENEKRPVFIGLGRRYGSRGGKYTLPHPCHHRRALGNSHHRHSASRVVALGRSMAAGDERHTNGSGRTMGNLKHVFQRQGNQCAAELASVGKLRARGRGGHPALHAIVRPRGFCA